MARDIRIELGFSGGGSASANAPEDAVEALTRAAGNTGDGGSGWHVLTSSDGASVHFNLDSLEWIRVDTSTRSVGFAQL